MTSSWQLWALLSAVFAALTAIFAKVGVEGINSDLATLVRTVIVLVSLLDGGHAEPVIGHAFARPVGFAHPTRSQH